MNKLLELIARKLLKKTERVLKRKEKWKSLSNKTLNKNNTEKTYGAVSGNRTLSFISAVVEYSFVVTFIWVLDEIFSNILIISSGVTYKCIG